jgi:arylsulfatase A-like enzyme
MKGAFLASTTLCLAMGLAVPGAHATGGASCPLNQPSSRIQHVVYLQFDNVHLRRDNPNVPSDLEQIPSLYNFLRTKGTLGSNSHTQLISHTADGIITTLTGVYPDRTGAGLANSFNYYKPDGTAPFISTFGYWTNVIPDGTPLMVDEQGKIAPAPWVPFTRAGCDVGNVSVANTVLENNSSDVVNVFGAGSPEAKESSAQKTADFVGIAIHCGNSATSICSAPGANPRADTLPDEPGGYSGFQALFGHKYVGTAINGGSAAITDLFGAPLDGFPGFDSMFPQVTGAYVAKMLESGVQVVFGYVSDAHDQHPSGPAYGPGEAGYVAQLQEYEKGFAAFFNELKAHGIDETNTLFVITADEGDHFAGVRKTGCDGVTTPCVYNTGEIGEVEVLVNELLAAAGITTQYGLHFDMAPGYYLNGDPSETATVTRQFEQALAGLTIADPYKNATVPLSVGLADRASMKLLHMVSGDPLRTPTVVTWNEPNAWVQSGSGIAVSTNPAFAWMHGGIQHEIAQTWLGLVGPGVMRRGIDSDTWTDHTDVRPTILALLGLHDDYIHDGRVIVEQVQSWALPAQVQANPEAYRDLARAYKRLNAPFGDLSMASIKYATDHIKSIDTAAYNRYLAEIRQFTARRDALATQIKGILDGAAFDDAPIHPGTVESLADRANEMVEEMQNLVRDSSWEREISDADR